MENQVNILKKLESSGKHIHEAPILMYAPYVVLAIITVAIGLTGPTVVVFLEGSLARHLEHAVNMEIHEHVFSLNRIVPPALMEKRNICRCR